MFCLLGNTNGLEGTIERVDFQYTTFKNDILQSIEYQGFCQNSFKKLPTCCIDSCRNRTGVAGVTLVPKIDKLLHKFKLKLKKQTRGVNARV